MSDWTPPDPPETMEARILRRLNEETGPWVAKRDAGREAVATVLAEELGRLRDEMREEFDARYASKHVTLRTGGDLVTR